MALVKNIEKEKEERVRELLCPEGLAGSETRPRAFWAKARVKEADSNSPRSHMTRYAGDWKQLMIDRNATTA